MNPVDNHFYMKNDISYDYKFIIGNFFGLILNHEANKSYVEQKGDYERSIRHYLLDGGVVRIGIFVLKLNLKRIVVALMKVNLIEQIKLKLIKMILIKYYQTYFI